MKNKLSLAALLCLYNSFCLATDTDRIDYKNRATNKELLDTEKNKKNSSYQSKDLLKKNVKEEVVDIVDNGVRIHTGVSESDYNSESEIQELEPAITNILNSDGESWGHQLSQIWHKPGFLKALAGAIEKNPLIWKGIMEEAIRNQEENAVQSDATGKAIVLMDYTRMALTNMIAQLGPDGHNTIKKISSRIFYVFFFVDEKVILNRLKNQTLISSFLWLLEPITRYARNLADVLSNTDENGQTLLHRLAARRDTKTLSLVTLFIEISWRYVASSELIDLQDNKGNTALIYALKKRQKDVATLLVLRGADVNIINKKGKTARNYASGKNMKKILGDGSLSGTLVSFKEFFQKGVTYYENIAERIEFCIKAISFFVNFIKKPSRTYDNRGVSFFNAPNQSRLADTDD